MINASHPMLWNPYSRVLCPVIPGILGSSLGGVIQDAILELTGRNGGTVCHDVGFQGRVLPSNTISSSDILMGARGEPVVKPKKASPSLS